MTIELTDDGTLDTVLRCSECGEEMRYNFSSFTFHFSSGEPEGLDGQSYDDFVDWAIEDATQEHECSVKECV